MNDKQFSYQLNHLDRVYYYLDKPDLYYDKSGHIKQFNLVQRVCLCVSKIFKRIERIWNYLFGDHYAYNELRARRIVCHYLNRKSFSENQSKSIIAIYDRLKLIQEGNRCYADGIDAKLVQQIESLRSGSFKINDINVQPKKISKHIPKTSPKLQKVNTQQDQQIKKTLTNDDAQFEKPEQPTVSELSDPPNTTEKIQPEDSEEIVKPVPNPTSRVKPTLKPKAKIQPKPVVLKIDADKYLLSTHQAKEFDTKKFEEDSLAHRYRHYKLDKPSLRTLMHLHGNRFGANSNLEGLPKGDATALRYLQEFLKMQLKQQNDPAIQKFVSRLDAVIALKMHKDVPSLSEAIKTKLEEAFKSKNALLIPAGWIGSPNGHALYFEICEEPAKDANQPSSTASMRIYNSGAGINHHNSAYVGNKEKFQPYITWKGIQKDKLLDEDFLKAVAEMQLCKTIPKTNHNTDYDERDVYIALKEILNPSSTDEGSEPSCLITDQTAGVCGMRGLFAVLCTYLEEEGGLIGKAVYKRFKCDIRIQSLVDYIINPMAEAEISPLGTRRFIQKSFQKICRSVDRLYNREFVSDAYVIEATDALNKVKRWLIENKETSASKYYEPSYMAVWSSIDLHSLKAKTADSIEGSQEVPKMVAEQLKALTTGGFQGIDKILDELQKIGESAWKEGADQALYTGLVYFVNHLPKDVAFWKEACSNNVEKINFEVAKNLIVKLEKVAHLFFKSCFTIYQSEVLVPERIETLIKLARIQHCLADLIKVPLNYPSLSIKVYNDDLSCFIITNEESSREFNAYQLKTFPHAHYAHINHPTQSQLEVRFLKNWEESITNVAREVAPESIKEIVNSVKIFAKLPTFSQNAEIFASDYLPDWLIAARNTHLYIHYMNGDVVGKPDSLDRSKDLRLKFEVIHEDKQSTVKIDLEGLERYLIRGRYSIVNDYSTNQHKRFMYMHGQMSSKPLYDFLLHVVSKYRNQEKEFLCDQNTFSQIGMKREEFQELFHIFSNDRTQPLEAVEYFNKYSEKLKMKDYQIIFRVALFQPSLGISSLSKMKGIEKVLIDFLDRQFNLWSASNAIQGCVYLIQTKRFLKRFFSLPSDGVARLRKLLLHHQLENEEKSIIFAELLAQIACIESVNLTEDDLNDLLAGLAFLKENPIPEKWREPLTENEVRKAAYLHENAIQNYLHENKIAHQDRLNSIFLVLRPDSKAIVKWKSNGANEFVSENARYLYRPVDGVFIDNENSEVMLPDEIRKHPYFQLICKGISKGKRCPDNTYAVGNQHHFRVLLTTDSISIYQKVEGEWATYIPFELFMSKDKDSKMKSAFGSRCLTEEFSHWRMHKDQSKIHFQDLYSKKFEYVAKVKFERAESMLGGKGKWKVLEVCDTKGLRLNTTSNYLTRFEHYSYIHEWFDEHKQLQKIELPRFSLSFTVQDNAIACDQFRGFYLAADQSISLLGPYQHYLVIADVAGKKKVLIPYWNFIKHKNKKEVFELMFDIDRQLEKYDRSPEQFFAYDVDPSGKLISRSVAANLYLALALTAVQEYRTAAFYLRRNGCKINSYSKLEIEILEQICKLKETTGDHDGNAAGIRTFAGFLLLKNGVQYHRGNRQLLDFIFSSYSDYLNQYCNAVEMRLQPREEIFLLTNLLQHRFEPLLFLRLRELDPDAARTIVRPNENPSKVNLSHNAIEDIIPRISYAYGNIFQFDYEIPDFSQVLITRAHHSFKRHFWGYYALAITGNEKERNWLHKAVCFLCTSSKQEEQTMGKIFRCLLRNYLKIKTPPVKSCTFLSAEEHNTLLIWRTDLISTIQGLLNEDFEKENKEKSAAVLRNLTPGEFQIEISENENNTSEISIKLENTPKDKSWNEEVMAFFQEKNQVEEKASKEFSDWLEASINRSEDLEKQTYEALQKEVAITNGEKKYGLRNGTGLNKIKNFLTEDENFLTLKQKHEKEILDLCNKQPVGQIDIVRRDLALSGARQKPLTIEEVIVHFARHKQFPKTLQLHNSALTSADVNNIYQLTFKYLILMTAEQQRKRAISTLSKLEKVMESTVKDLAEDDLLQQFVQDISAKHHGNPIEQPYFLALEYFADILLRPEQIEKIEEFLKEGNSNIIMEMLMGFGKSKILLPLLALLLANPGTMSLLVCPQSLFENIASDTQHILRDAFGQMLLSLHFDRNSSFTEQSLLNILNDLEAIKKQGDCLLMTGKSLQCLLLKFIDTFNIHVKEYEARVKEDNNAIFELSAELKLMQKILNCFDAARTIVDEADSVLNVLRKVCFSLGQRYFPVAHEVCLISKIYSLLYTNPLLKKIVRLESDPDAYESAPMLTEKIYQEELKEALAVELLNGLPALKLGSANHDKALKEFSATLQSNRELVHHYVTRNLTHREAAQEFFNAQCYEIKEVLALASQVISQFLPHTLTRVNNEKYGIDPESQLSIAIPFLAANTPSRGSLFSNHHVTMMYTFQAIVKNGVNRDILLHEIERMQSQAMTELRNANNEISLEDTQTWKRFGLLKGNIEISLLNNYRLKPQLLDVVVNQINKDVNSKIAFAEFIVIPQLDLFEEHLSCNPINLSSFLPSLSGFTGTLWNAKSMHRKLNDKPAAGINAKTLNILFANSRERIVSLEENTATKMMEQLHKQIQNFDVIIDAGGYFKRGTNLEIAHELAKWLQTNTKKTHVVFYNHLGEQTITDGIKELPLAQSSVSESERIVFLDQDHTIGADVSYKRDAIGILTCGSLMIDRDFKQGAWRLRRLDKLQKVVFALSKDVEMIIQQTTGKKSKIILDEITQFVISNQCRQQSKDNFKGFLQQLWDIPQQILISFMRNSVLKAAEYLQLFKELRTLWIKPGTSDANQLYGNIAFERLTSEIVIDEKSKCDAFLKKVFQQCPWLEEKGISLKASLEQIDELISRVQSSLPKRTVHPEMDAELSIEVEQQQEEEVEREVELEVQEEILNSEMRLKRSTERGYFDVEQLTDDLLSKDKVVRFPLKLYFEKNPELVPFAKAFDDLDVTLHVFAVPKEAQSVRLLQLFGIYRTPLHFVDIEGDRVTILSQTDASNALLGGFIKGPGLYNLGLGFCKKVEKPSLVVQKKIVKVKFLNGDTHYTVEESRLLSDWLKEAGPKLMKQLFIKRILAGFPMKAAAYHGSVLHKIFNKLIKKK